MRRGLARLGRADEALADRIADAFTEMRRDEYRLYPDAHATVDALREAGVKLALVTNGAAETQRDKIERFELGHRFDHIQIEGEFGQGKPELAVYRHALERLEVDAGDAWMVGDNYEWEVVAPQQLGMCGIWYDPFDAGVPAHATAKPTRIIKRLAELSSSTRQALTRSFGSLSAVCSIRRSTRPPFTRCVCSTSSMSSLVGQEYQTPSG